MSEYIVVPPYHRPTLERYIVGDNGGLTYTDHGAFDRSLTVRYELRLPRAVMPRNAVMYIWHESGGDAKRFEMARERLERDADLFAVTISMAELADSFSMRTGLFYYAFDVDSRYGLRYIRQSRIGLPELRGDDFSDGAFALTVYERKYPAPESWYGGIIYHIFVDRFKSSGKCEPKPYAKMEPDWYGGIKEFPAFPGAPLANESFFGGDLYGIRDKLDYIKSLGVTCIYLSPVFDAHSNHKYDTGNYEHVDSMFGGKRALDRLIAAAKKLGIRVILDGVFNHTGDDSKYFNKYGRYTGPGAYNSDRSKYYKWYKFFDYPDDYESWWGIKILPRVNSSDESYIEYISGKDGIIDKYTSSGIAGWRLDVVDELSDEFVERLAQRAHESAKDDVPLVIGEVWEDASCKIAYGHRRRYFLGDQLDSVMNYPMRAAIINFVAYRDETILMRSLFKMWEHYPHEVCHAVMNLLGTHDTVRIITTLAGDSPDGFKNAELAVKKMTSEQYARGRRLVELAYMINATIPGIPSIYYGDEAGVEGYSDPFNRLPFPWGREDVELLSFYRDIGELRRNNDVYKKGELFICRFNIVGFMMFGRGDGEHTYYTAVNRSDNVIIVATTDEGREVLISAGDVGANEDGVVIPPMSGAVIKMSAKSAVSAENVEEETDQKETEF